MRFFVCERCSMWFDALNCICGRSIITHDVFSGHRVANHRCEPWFRDLCIRGGR